jgi:hypothetical protein
MGCQSIAGPRIIAPPILARKTSVVEQEAKPPRNRHGKGSLLDGKNSCDQKDTYEL